MLFAYIEKYLGIGAAMTSNKNYDIKPEYKFFEMDHTVRNLPANGIMSFYQLILRLFLNILVKQFKIGN